MEKSKTADQLVHPALQLIAACHNIFARQGAIVSTWRRRGSKHFGPYYSLIYRENGRQRSIYLGRSVALLEQVRQAIAALRHTPDRLRLIERVRRQTLASLRIERLRLGSLLRPYGLRLKGAEVRGWRVSPLRNLLPRCRRVMRRLSTRPPRHRPKESPAQRLARYLSVRDGTPIEAFDIGPFGPLPCATGFASASSNREKTSLSSHSQMPLSRWAKRVMPAVLQKLMRHSTIETTLRYNADIDADELAEQLWKDQQPINFNNYDSLADSVADSHGK